MKKTKGRMRWQYYIIIPAVVIALLFGAFIGIQAISASMNKGEPVFGGRFDNDLDPKISQESMDTIVSKLKALNNVKDARIELKAATMRVYVEVDTNREASMSANLQNYYDEVIEVLNVKDYFTINGLQNQYDLEIHGYNRIPTEDTKGYIYGVLVKGSNMNEPKTQILTKPQSQEVVDFFIEEEKRKDEAQNQPPVEEPEDTTEE